MAVAVAPQRSPSRQVELRQSCDNLPHSRQLILLACLGGESGPGREGEADPEPVTLDH